MQISHFSNDSQNIFYETHFHCISSFELQVLHLYVHILAVVNAFTMLWTIVLVKVPSWGENMYHKIKHMQVR